MELEGQRLEAAVKIAAAAAHELRQPMTIISGFSELLKNKAKRGEDIKQETDIIISQCNRMNAIITKMLNVTAYRTKAYGGTTEIFDLGVDNEEREKS
jgi:signal transduction histidine kinase